MAPRHMVVEMAVFPRPFRVGETICGTRGYEATIIHVSSHHYTVRLPEGHEHFKDTHLVSKDEAVHPLESELYWEKWTLKRAEWDIQDLVKQQKAIARKLKTHRHKAKKLRKEVAELEEKLEAEVTLAALARIGGNA